MDLAIGIAIGAAAGVALTLLGVWLKSTGLPRPKERDACRPPPGWAERPASGASRLPDKGLEPPPKTSTTEWTGSIGGLGLSVGVTTTVEKHNVVFPDEVLALAREGRIEEAAARLATLRNLSGDEAKGMMDLYRKFAAKAFPETFRKPTG